MGKRNYKKVYINSKSLFKRYMRFKFFVPIILSPIKFFFSFFILWFFLLQAMTQERRRYGFVLERQCSLAKHYLAYHTAGVTSYNRHLDEWQDIARSREYLPESVENMFTTKLRVSNKFFLKIFYSFKVR